MEKLGKAYEKEYMKMAMLKHERTFKQQVHELHRLYRTQKTLMTNVEESLEKRSKEICFRQIYEEDDAKEYYRSKLEGGEDEGDDVQMIKENEVELTLGPSTNYNYNNNITNSDSGVTHCCSSSTGSSHEGISPVCQNGTNNRADKKIMLHSSPHPWLFQVVTLNI